MASANVHSHTKAYIVRYLAPTVASSTLTANDLSHKVNKGNLLFFTIGLMSGPPTST